jgi:antitoxin (DNA-binding transcriptional repressor) of toxin-antitoxin stability system
MTPLTIDEAQGRLREVLAGLQPGEEVALTDNGQPVAKLVREQPKPTLRPPPGLCKGMITYIAPDFDAPLEDMKEYME